MHDAGERTYAEAIAAAAPMLINGAMETRLRFATPWTEQPGIDDPVDDDRWRTLLALYTLYGTIAREFDLPILLQAPTLSGSEWFGAAPEDWPRLAQRDRHAIDQLRAVPPRIPGLEAFLGGIVSPVGNAYDAADGTGADRAGEVHRARASLFAEAGVDVAVLAPWPSVAGATVALQAVVPTGMPTAVAFLLDTNGDVLDGTPLSSAITTLDEATATPPLHYTIQCVHPRRAARGLKRLAEGAPDLLDRVRAVRANAADRDVDDLDESDTLHGDGPEEWAEALADLHVRYGLAQVGGCCGTDERHTMSLALRVAG